MARSRRLSQLADLVVGAASAALGDRRPGEPAAGEELIVATSGGPDSGAALWACAQVGEVRAIHVDHGWPHSRIMRSAAIAVAGHLGVSIIEEQIQVGSSEAEARAGRYEAFARHLDPGLIVTGHNADDLAETVAANLARGAGLDGRQGIPSARPGFARPFLSIRRAQLRELSALLGLPTIDDPANRDPAYTRVRLRRLVRGWEGAMGRPIVPAISRGAVLAGEDAALLEASSAHLQVRTDGSVVVIDLATLLTAERPLVRRAVRRAMRALDGIYPGTSADVEAILQVIDGGQPSQVGGGVRVRRSAGRLELSHLQQVKSQPPPPVAINDDGVYRFGRWRFLVEWADRRPTTLAASRLHEVFDASVSTGGLSVRAVGPGDLLALRDGGSKSAVTAMAELRIEESERAGWPILVSDTEGPLWVPDVRRAAVGWVTGATQRYLVVAASQEERWTPVVY